MTYDEFVDRISITLSDLGVSDDDMQFLPKGFKPEKHIQKVFVDNYNRSYYSDSSSDTLIEDALIVGKVGSDSLFVAPIPLKLYYEYYKAHNFAESSWEMIHDNLKQTVMSQSSYLSSTSNSGPLSEDIITNYASAREKMVLYPVNAVEKRESTLHTALYRQYGDYAIVAGIAEHTPTKEDRQLPVIEIPKKILRSWKVSEKQVFDDAFKNMMENYPAYATPITDPDSTYNVLEDTFEMGRGLILTNNAHTFSSVSMFYPGVAEKLFAAAGNDAFAFYPMDSIHMLVFPFTKHIRAVQNKFNSLLEQYPTDAVTNRLHYFDGQHFRISGQP